MAEERKQTPKQRERKQRDMKRRLRGLKNKKYPLNKYEIQEDGNLFMIIRTEGTRPHRKKGEKKVSKNG